LVLKEQVKVEKNLMNWMESSEVVRCEIEIEEGIVDDNDNDD